MEIKGCLGISAEKWKRYVISRCIGLLICLDYVVVLRLEVGQDKNLEKKRYWKRYQYRIFLYRILSLNVKRMH